MLADPWEMFFGALVGSLVLLTFGVGFGASGWWLVADIAFGALAGAWLGSSPP